MRGKESRICSSFPGEFVACRLQSQRITLVEEGGALNTDSSILLDSEFPPESSLPFAPQSQGITSVIEERGI